MATGLTRLIVSLLALCVSDALGFGKDVPVFESSVQEVLRTRCGKCHCEDLQKGDLDLSSIHGVRRGGESGEPLIGETLDESHLWSVIESGEMPPDDESPLEAEEVTQISDWLRAGGHSVHAAAEQDMAVDSHQVFPVLLLRCNSCHGPRLRQNGVDLRTREAMLVGGENGPSMVPGAADESLMIRRIESGACPPSESLLKFFVRRPSTQEVQVLRSWIDQGAPLSDRSPDVQTDQADLLVSEEDRQHWAFQSPVKPRGKNHLDQFVAARLSEHDLGFAPEANRSTLIRRVFLDLTGLPPTPEELLRWSRSEGSEWYPLMVDHLLASDRYGERWGRYWLDLAGYADSEGGISADPLRQDAWKYRDYVIDAFNRDLPYDQFLLQQLAGDELIDHANAAEVTDEMVRHIVATGFLRMGIDETGSRTMNFVPERLKVIGDALAIVSSGLMGLTMECARCHSHKYDPIPQRDYYRLKAVFQGAFDEHDWDSFKTRKIQLGTPHQVARVKQINPPLSGELKRLQSKQKRLSDELKLMLLRHHYPNQSEAEHRSTLAALKVADNNRTLTQKILVERLAEAELVNEHLQPLDWQTARAELAELQEQMNRVRRKMAPSLSIRALWDLGRPSTTYVLRRGEHELPGMPVGPGVPAVLTDGKTPFKVTPPFPGGTPKSGRRLAFARWLTGPKHPLTARVMVNRLWYHHFGSALTPNLDNFGLQSDPPTHPDLLDWLAVEFVESGWSIKHMHRLILQSRTYRQHSRVSPAAAQRDPQNKLLSRYPMRRLDAEALRDSLLAVSGALNLTPGGLPDPVTVDRDGLVSANASAGGGWRRSVYLQYRRTEIPSMMDTFDYPQMGPNCLSRNVSTVSPQALLLLNNDHVRELAARLARRVERSLPDPVSGESPDLRRSQQVEMLYRIVLARAPLAKERDFSITSLAQLEKAWEDEPGRALESLSHTLLNSASFLYVD